MSAVVRLRMNISHNEETSVSDRKTSSRCLVRERCGLEV